MENRTKVAAVAIALMTSPALALMPDTGTHSSSVQAKFDYVLGLTPGDFPSMSDYLTATLPWPCGSVTHTIGAL